MHISNVSSVTTRSVLAAESIRVQVLGESTQHSITVVCELQLIVWIQAALGDKRNGLETHQTLYLSQTNDRIAVCHFANYRVFFLTGFNLQQQWNPVAWHGSVQPELTLTWNGQVNGGATVHLLSLQQRLLHPNHTRLHHPRHLRHFQLLQVQFHL